MNINQFLYDLCLIILAKANFTFTYILPHLLHHLVFLKKNYHFVIAFAHALA